MALLTVAELREHVETAMGDAALLRIIDRCEARIVARAGPLDWDPYEDTIADNTEVHRPSSRYLPVLKLRQDPAAITTVTDTGTELTEDVDYYVTGRHLVRVSGYWGDRVTVVYEPVNDVATRQVLLVQLCQLELNFQPGMASQGAGPWSESYGSYRKQQGELLEANYPAAAPRMVAVPVEYR